MAIPFKKSMDYQILFCGKLYYGTYYYWDKIHSLENEVTFLLSTINKDTDKRAFRSNLNAAADLQREIASVVASGLWQGDIVPMGVKLAEEREVG